MVKQGYKLLKTERIEEMILHNNHFYTKHHCGKIAQTWRCQKRKCPAKVITTPLNIIEHITSSGIHNHILSENDISTILLNNKIRNMSNDSAYTTRQVYDTVTSTMKSYERPILNKRNIYKNIQNLRRRNSVVIDKNKNFDELQVSTLRGEDFCLFDSGALTLDRIVAFTTEVNLSFLSNSFVLVADGTFRVCPREFLQLYTLHGEINSKIFPLVYILLKTKKETDYLKIFDICFQKVWSRCSKKCYY